MTDYAEFLHHTLRLLVGRITQQVLAACGGGGIWRAGVVLWCEQKSPAGTIGEALLPQMRGGKKKSADAP